MDSLPCAPPAKTQRSLRTQAMKSGDTIFAVREVEVQGAEWFVPASLAAEVRHLAPQLRIGWYSGRTDLPEGVAAATFDYIKLGPYDAARGALTSPETNQRMYRVDRNGTMEDITYRFRRR